MKKIFSHVNIFQWSLTLDVFCINYFICEILLGSCCMMVVEDFVPPLTKPGHHNMTNTAECHMYPINNSNPLT